LHGDLHTSARVRRFVDFAATAILALRRVLHGEAPAQA